MKGDNMPKILTSKLSVVFYVSVLWVTNIVCEKLYYSQHGQDKFIYETFFKDKIDGFFVEAGANDGIAQSNTFFFEKTLGWKGLCVEPIPEVFERLKNNRRCTCFQGCISNFEGTATFVEFLRRTSAINNDLEKFYIRCAGDCDAIQNLVASLKSSLVSGLVEKFDPRHLERWGHLPNKIISVPCYLPKTVFDMYGIKHIDFLSLDTEGGEFDILKSIDFSSVYISVLQVEDRWPDGSIKEFLMNKGFAFVARIGNDDIYKNTH